MLKIIMAISVRVYLIYEPLNYSPAKIEEGAHEIIITISVHV